MEAISRIVRSAFCAYAQEQTPPAACVFADGVAKGRTASESKLGIRTGVRSNWAGLGYWARSQCGGTRPHCGPPVRYNLRTALRDKTLPHGGNRPHEIDRTLFGSAPRAPPLAPKMPPSERILASAAALCHKDSGTFASAAMLVASFRSTTTRRPRTRARSSMPWHPGSSARATSDAQKPY